MTSIRKTSSPGVTLIELIMVMIVLFIVAGLAVPFLMNALPESRLQSGGAQVYAALTKARMEAATYGVRARVLFSLEEKTFRVVRESNPLREADRFEVVEASWDTTRLPEGVEIHEIAGLETDSETGEAYVEFRSDGTVAKEAKIVLQNEEGDQRILIVAPMTGRVRFEEKK